jgi:hypothetical protein
VSLRRFAARSDSSRSLIVEAIRKAGWKVWDIRRPCDILCWKATKGFRCIEIKTPRGKKNPKATIDKRNKEQIEFIELTGTPRCTTPESALLFLNS